MGGKALSAVRSRKPGKARTNSGGQKTRRPKSDFYCTPWRATRAGIAAFGHMLPAGAIEDPFAGKGDILKVLQEPDCPLRNRPVYKSDLRDWRADPKWQIETGVDFLKQQQRRAPIILSNAPYAIIDSIMDHANKLEYEVVALFCNLPFLASIERQAIMRGRDGRVLGLEYLYTCIDRVTMYPGMDRRADKRARAKNDGAGGIDTGSAVPSAWFVFSREGKRLAAETERLHGPMRAWWRGGFIDTREFVKAGDGRDLLPLPPPLPRSRKK